MVTFHCESTYMQSEVLQYDADACRLLMRTYDPEACSQWLLLLPFSWQPQEQGGAAQVATQPWNVSTLFAPEDLHAPLTIPSSALPLQSGSKGRARVLIHRILSESVTSKGASTAALPVYVPASYFLRASQAVEAAADSAAAADVILVAMYVSSTSHSSAVALHKALQRSSQQFTLLLLCSDNLKKFLQVLLPTLAVPALFFKK
jgi:hypothetical protein